MLAASISDAKQIVGHGELPEAWDHSFLPAFEMITIIRCPEEYLIALDWATPRATGNALPPPSEPPPPYPQVLSSMCMLGSLSLMPRSTDHETWLHRIQIGNWCFITKEENTKQGRIVAVFAWRGTQWLCATQWSPIEQKWLIMHDPQSQIYPQKMTATDMDSQHGATPCISGNFQHPTGSRFILVISDRCTSGKPVINGSEEGTNEREAVIERRNKQTEGMEGSESESEEGSSWGDNALDSPLEDELTSRRMILVSIQNRFTVERGGKGLERQSRMRQCMQIQGDAKTRNNPSLIGPSKDVSQQNTTGAAVRRINTLNEQLWSSALATANMSGWARKVVTGDGGGGGVGR